MSVGVRVARRLLKVGRLDVALPSGEKVVIGDGEPSADLIMHDREALPRILREGILGFAESYMGNQVDTNDLDRLIEWGVANQAAWFEHPAMRLTDPLRRFWQKIRPRRRHPKVQTMNQHYNLGNDFYATWLDPAMTYSSARFTHPDQSLEDAQRNKYRTIADGAGISEGMRVLEIGCGWGGFAVYAARERDAEVVGVTLSENQAAGAIARAAVAGLSDRIEIRIEDFRETTGTFDAVVSIEMIESVDETHWPPLFQTIRERLRPGGLAAMQIITIGDTFWERYRSRADFIQQYIFPGGQLPSPKILRKLSEDAGLEIVKIDTFGPDYARTLDAWKDGFRRSWESLAAEHGLDERFRRMWELYLTLCAAGFRMGRINVEQWVFQRP